MAGRLENLKIAVLATDGFEEVELTGPVEAYRKEGADVRIVSPKGGKIKAWRFKEWSMDLPVDIELKDARPQDFDALHLPGGVINPDYLRLVPEAVEFVRAMHGEGKPVAAICHGPWMLVEAGIVSGRKVTSWPSLKTDLRNAGADWVDQEVVEDGNLITSRKPDDIPAYSEATIEAFSRAPQASPS